ncbi:hypothetical protein LEP1GSC018_0721 [Leptospira kirschneri str. 2008720114]|uniref:Uncharacterized protein n=1 Tax=Leptospira kirschneri str. H1 TaxID=1049966 RepID=A0A0E2AXK2_9LEPT|nr:hypothetical protein LEP1GSC081_0145 [Leptospira kirschneri str. H1]EKP03954.1 hypothetical protein LEP1GSC018_0721 [Leptospira kirschneri str. 2008720114]
MDSETSIKSISGSWGLFRKIFIDLSIELKNRSPLFSFTFCIRKG